jgi:hypothetical protein
MTITGSSNCTNSPIFYLTGVNSAFMIGTDSSILAGQSGAQTVPTGGFSAATVNGETFYGGTQEVVNQNAQSENDIITFSGGSGANLAGNAISDDTSIGSQEANQVGPIAEHGSAPTIASDGVITQTKNGVAEAQGVAIDSTHFIILNNSGSSFPSINTFGPTTGDTAVGVSLSPTTAQSIAVSGAFGITATVTGTTSEVAAGITWTFNGLAGGAGFGSISGTYPNFTYNAPSTVPSPATFNITATSNADVSKSASVSVTIE